MSKSSEFDLERQQEAVELLNKYDKRRLKMALCVLIASFEVIHKELKKYDIAAANTASYQYLMWQEYEKTIT